MFSSAPLMRDHCSNGNVENIPLFFEDCILPIHNKTIRSIFQRGAQNMVALNYKIINATHDYAPLLCSRAASQIICCYDRSMLQALRCYVQGT